VHLVSRKDRNPGRLGWTPWSIFSAQNLDSLVNFNARQHVTLEPAYGPAFYQVLFESDIYALIRAGDAPTQEGRVRFVMWTGEDGQQVIPFFSNRAAVRRALNANTQALRVNGRVFLESCRGAFVVLNPNERYFCRLTPSELALLLDTGSPNLAEDYVTTRDMQVEIAMPDAPPEMLTSLSLLFAQEPAVERAFLVTLRSDESAPPVWLVAAFIATDDAAQWVRSRWPRCSRIDRHPTVSIWRGSPLKARWPRRSRRLCAPFMSVRLATRSCWM
jgi:hypothetical protein